MSRKLKYFLTALLALTFIILITGLIITRFYQDEIKKLMISEINKHVNSEIKVKDISFSVLRRFPSASVEFKDVLVKVPVGYLQDEKYRPNSDTLFSAKNLFLQFNIRDIFRKQYRVTTINARNGVLYLSVNTEGQENFRFWKTSETAGEDFDFDLQNLRLANYRVKFGNHLKDVYLDSDLRRLELKGNFSRSSYRLSGMLQGTTRELRNKDLIYTGDQDFSLQALLDVNHDLITIEEGIAELSGIRLEASGKYSTGENGNISMNFSGENLDIASFISLIPPGSKEGLNKYGFNGKVDFDASLTGRLSKTLSPTVTASFKTRGGAIQRKSTGMQLSDITLTGYYTNGDRQSPESSTIIISDFSSVFGRGNVTGKVGISNLSRPEIDFNIKASFLLEELAGFYQPGNILQMAGSVNTTLTGKGRLQKLVAPDIRELSNMDLAGALEIGNGMLEMFEGKYVASTINGKLLFGNAIRTPGLSFNVDSDHFLLEGEIVNGLPWFLGDDETMTISGSLYSKNLNIDNYLHTDLKEKQDGDSVAERMLFPRNLELNLDYLVDNLTFRKFSSTGFNGKLSYKPYMLTMNTVDFNSMEGMVSGNGVIIQKLNGDFMVQSQLELQDVDMQKMFLSFNNFGQSFIHGENLKGSLTGSLGFISEWSRDLQLNRENIVADSKVEIKNGELIDFEPMLGLARYIDVNELQHIRFSTLNNEIFIRNNLVTIPHMDVNSSAINVSGSGTHHFNGHFEYRLRVLLSDVLYGRAARSKPENTRYGIVEDDGLGRTSLYLLVSGDPRDINVAYDHRMAREVIRENIANERNVLRNLFHEEFGWFEADTTLKESPVTRDPGPRFRITWDEDDVKTGTPPRK